VPLPYDALRGFLLSSTLHLSTGPMHVLAAIATFTLVTGLAAVWPSFQAARMRPVRAMQAP
jgi:ABC-type antimicrobial peptide transport system permease subunit